MLGGGEEYNAKVQGAYHVVGTKETQATANETVAE